ncbi:MAG: lytic murein transglycosylase [Candidatus Contendobacter odensis]|uniref:Lytic murein transglycosylase n=1 Tax=Candidatus Contendibacter odensensis TaxID=1400860 RepID=A0A2G6PFH0_9GAMM|nr:MAG: lytic murein transglycosylase [Candidatus Contendobacter odensis]
MKSTPGSIVLYALLVACAFGTTRDTYALESLNIQRSAFQFARRSLQAGIPIHYAALHNYPLYPYLRYQDISRRLSEFPSTEVRTFLKKYSDTPLARRLRYAWLSALARAERWEDYRHDYVPTRNIKFDCWQRQALLDADQHTKALHDFARLWLRGSSLPIACDPVIAAWQAQGYPHAQQRWRRFALAMESNQAGLARFLLADMPAADRSLARSWLAIADNPTLILDTTQLPTGDPRIIAILNNGLNRWRQHNARAAAAALDVLKKRDPSLAPKLATAERLLALWIASDYHPDASARLIALPDAVVDKTVREWRVRVALQKNDWTAVLHWIKKMPSAERNSPRWHYWRARALESLGRKPKDAQAIYRSIAEQRDYYGFLAANRINTPYRIVSKPLTLADAQLDALLAKSPGLQRAHELYLLDYEAEATAEWRNALHDFNRNVTYQKAALLAHRWNWHSQAILTLAKAEYWDDLEVRFPVAYKNSVMTHTRANGLDPAWVYAVIRQESSFRPEVRSPAGALGLMQIMPATGQHIARQLQDTPVDKPALLHAETNIRYGVYYLQRLLEKLQQNQLLATAAYNAGAHKVSQWLPQHHPVPADIWAETIPYHETRAYVQRVMEYTMIYRYRLGQKSTEITLQHLMTPVLPNRVVEAYNQR